MSPTTTSASPCSRVLLPCEGMAFLSFCIMFNSYLADMGLLGSVLCSPLGFYCAPHWMRHCRLDHWGAPSRAECILPKQKCTTICRGKWSYAVTQMSQAEMKWCIVTALQADGEGLMVSAPRNRYTPRIEQSYNARTYLNIAAGLSHSSWSCSLQGADGYLKEVDAPSDDDRVVKECWVQDAISYNSVNDVDTVIPWYLSLWESPECSVCREEPPLLFCCVSHWCLSGFQTLAGRALNHCQDSWRLLLGLKVFQCFTEHEPVCSGHWLYILSVQWQIISEPSISRMNKCEF